MTKENTPEPADQRMLRQVTSKQQRLEQGNNKWAWTSIAVLGVIGWSITVPTLVGVALGLWIDRHYPSRFSWALMLLLGGLMFGCIQAWFKVREPKVREPKVREQKLRSDLK